MMKNGFVCMTKFLLPVFLSLAFVSCGVFEGRRYTDSQGIQNLESALPPPPADDSDEHKAELELVYTAQTTASPEVMRRAESEIPISPMVFKDLMGPDFDENTNPGLFDFLGQVRKESRSAIGFQKDKFHRFRPPVMDQRIKPLDAGNFDQTSYPSGHSFLGTLYALVLSEIYPEKAQVLMRRSQEIGWDRMVLGMHHPSDVTAGRILAQLVFNNMMANQDFRREIQKLKSNVSAK